MVCGNTFAKTICSICYEDLKPIVEDLQSISICGHIFHELCIQQWFEYCSNGKKRNCPVCKQTCSEVNVGRLYFQSVGDSNGSSFSQKPINCEEDPEELRREIEKLEGKISGLGSALERHQKDVKELSEQNHMLHTHFCISMTAQVVVGTPGTINKWVTAKKLSTNYSKILVFDEADHMLAECISGSWLHMRGAHNLCSMELQMIFLGFKPYHCFDNR